MIIRRNILLATAAGLVLASQAASAAVIDLIEYAFNIDGAVADITLGDPVPFAVDLALFDDVTGLGTIDVTLAGAGPRYVGLFVDHEIDEATNTYFNEFGSVTGAAAAGQTWEIDEPGYVFGDIWDNFGLSMLDNSNGVPAGSEDDVSMAMAWDFDLLDGETALITFLLSEMMPTAGFYLAQTDPDSLASVYLSSVFAIEGGGPIPAPVPATLALFGAGLIGLRLARRRASESC
jgi:hypothetical protein